MWFDAMCFKSVESRLIVNQKSDAKCKINQDDAKCSNSIIDESDSECFRSISDAYEILDEIESERIMSLSITFKRIR